MNQETALAILKSGVNAFLTGSAGSGKTYVLNRYIQYLKKRKVPVAVTASTGIAATHMGGMTIHSWSGIGVRDTISGNDLRNMRSKKYLQKNMEDVKVLIIDEISMLHKKQLEAVNLVSQSFKENEQAFGGIQVVFSGDFFQLPPIGRNGESNENKFTFMSQAWQDASLTICYLTEQHRQEDNELNKILNEIRSGKPSPQAIEKLKASKHTRPPGNFTKLYTHNIDVDRINDEQLMALQGKTESFAATTKGNQKLLETLKKSVLTKENLKLKHKARVMFIKNNYEQGYMNGTLGEIAGFSEEGWPMVRTNDGRQITAEPEKWSIEDDKGKTLASFSQVPLRLAWAITVHKSQGMTLDAAAMDLSKTFEKGQGYVALSRVKSLKGLQLSGFNTTALEVDDLVNRADERFRELSHGVELNVNIKDLEKEAIDFLEKCGGITDPDEIERNNKKRQEKKLPKRSTYDITKDYIEQGLSIVEIAYARGFATRTIMDHILKISNLYPEVDISQYKPEEDTCKSVQTAYDKLVAEKQSENFLEDGSLKLKSLFNELNGQVSYDDIKLGLAFIMR